MMYIVCICNACMVSALKAVDEDSDITNCCKCRQLLTDPRTLPCLDSLCEKCFREVCDKYCDTSVGVAACPRCGDQFHLPTDSQALPDRGFIDKLVSLRKIANENMEENNCDICKQLLASSKAVAAAEYYCIECHQRMCAVCTRQYPMCSSTKSHNLVGLGLASAKEVLNRLKSYFPVCANHKGISAAIHCYQCNIALCSECQDMHSSHEIMKLTDDTYDQLTNTVKFLAGNLRQQLVMCNEEIERVQKLLFDRHSGAELAGKEICNKAGEMISLIQQEYNDLLSMLHSHCVQPFRSLQAVSARLSSDLSANENALKFAEELLEKGSVEDMLLNYRLLSDRVTRLCSMSGDSSVLDETVLKDASPDTLIHDVCTSLKSKSK